MPEMPAVFLIDTDPATWACVARIANQMQVGASLFASAEDFLAEHDRQTPGCIVSEFRLWGMNGIELQTLLSAECISLPVIFATGRAEIAFAVRAMQNGAITVLEKPLSEQELWDAIQTALNQNRKRRRIDARHSKVRRQLSKLTAKERAVLDLLLEGRANKVIAKTLELSIRTVETRRHEIFRKTGTDSIAQLVRLIIQTEKDDYPL